MGHLIFSYGSNLNMADLSRYCQDHNVATFLPKKVRNAKLSEYTLFWSVFSKVRGCGVLNIEPKKESVVWGTIFELTDEQLVLFDQKEGHPYHYRRECLVVVDDNGRAYTVETYIAPHCRETAYFYPSESYRSVVEKGMREQCLPNDYIELFMAWSPIIDYTPYPKGKCTKKTAIFAGQGDRGKTLVYWQKLYREHDLGELDIVYGHLFSYEIIKRYDLVILPGGGSKDMCHALGERGREELRHYIAEGGRYLGVCAGAYAATHQLREYIGLSPLVIQDYEHAHRGEAELKLSFNEIGSLAFGVSEGDEIPIIYHNGPICKYRELQGCDKFQVMATFVEDITPEGGLPGIMIGAPAAWKNRYGNGFVYAISPHIERTPGQEYLMANFIRHIFSI
jgi:hypothetical protein